MRELEEIIGTEIVNGMRLGHTFYEVGVIMQLIDEHKPIHFVEIGVHEGVLSKLITDKYPDLKYIGVEYDCGLIQAKDVWEKLNTRLLCVDAFDPNTIEIINKLDGRKIVYCDNGHKAREIIIYAPTLKPGDILITHDFSDGTRHGKGLPNVIGVEVFPEDIKFLENDPTFQRLTSSMFIHTRIVGFVKK